MGRWLYFTCIIHWISWYLPLLIEKVMCVRSLFFLCRWMLFNLIHILQIKIHLCIITTLIRVGYKMHDTKCSLLLSLLLYQRHHHHHRGGDRREKSIITINNIIITSTFNLWFVQYDEYCSKLFDGPIVHSISWIKC